MADAQGSKSTPGGVLWTLPAPAADDSPGRAGQISYDSSGNFYLDYGPNMWAKFTGTLIWPVQPYVFDFSQVANSQYIPILLGGFA